MKNRMKGTAVTAVLALFLTLAVGCGGKLNPVDSSSDTGSSVSTGNTNETDATEGTGEPGSSETSAPSDTNTTSNSGESSTGGGVTGSTNKTGTSGTKSNYAEKKYDLKGRVITIGTEGAPPDMKKKTIFNESIALTEKKFNCKFKFVQKSDYFGLWNTLINDHAAGTATYDVVNLRGYDVYPLTATSGSILQLEKYYDFKNDPTWNVDIFKTLGMFKGSRYGIPYTPNEVGEGIWYNRGLLRKFNVPDLWTYVNNNTWNWNTFRAVCKKLTKDTTGDGKPDYWAFTAGDPWLSFIFANNGSLLTSGISGAPKLALDSKNALEAIQFIYDLHVIDNTVPDGAELGKITDKPFNAMFTGKVAMAPYHARYGAVLEAQGIPSEDIGWVYFPKGPSATKYITASGTMPDMFVVPGAVKKPEEVVAAIQDLAAYWDESREIKHKVSDKTEELYGFLKTSLDANAKKILLHQAQNPVFTLSNNYRLMDTLQNELWPLILSGKKSVKSSVDSLKSKMQQEITNRYNGTVTK